jgi:hypothetical protein
MLTKLRPNVRTTSLRAKNYKQLKDRIKNAAARVAKASLPARLVDPGEEEDEGKGRGKGARKGRKGKGKR